MTARYAVYYTPDAAHPLTCRAAAWLGRDAFTGETVARPFQDGLDGLDLDALTEAPRGYGFHATLKAPFALAAGCREAEMLAAAEAFAARRTCFAERLAVERLDRFVALRLLAPSPAMQDLHAACVREFDGFRAPSTEADLARRRRARLTPAQETQLAAWGYPYVFDDFRFHMTLTSSLTDPQTAERLWRALGARFAGLDAPHRFDGVALFKQEDRAAPFRVLARLSFPDARGG